MAFASIGGDSGEDGPYVGIRILERLGSDLGCDRENVVLGARRPVSGGGGGGFRRRRKRRLRRAGTWDYGSRALGGLRSCRGILWVLIDYSSHSSEKFWRGV